MEGLYLMTARRFDNGLSQFERIMLSGALAGMLLILFPGNASAQVANKTSLVFEINNLKISGVHQYLFSSNDEQPVKPQIVVTAPVGPVLVVAPVKPAPKPVAYNLPPKATEKVYMQEPEIRAYICPKLGDKCNTFIAVLKAENGTHECTRDNRGLNKNGSVDVGLAQINWNPKYNPPYSFEQLQDCKFNLDIALKKYASRGFQPWSAYNSGAYLKHLPAVIAAAKITQ